MGIRRSSHLINIDINRGYNIIKINNYYNNAFPKIFTKLTLCLFNSSITSSLTI